MSNPSTLAVIMVRSEPAVPLTEVGNDQPDQTGGCPSDRSGGPIAENGVESDAAGVEPLCEF